MRTDTALTPIRRVLVGGPPAGGPGAVEVGARMAKRLGAKLRVVHVQEPHPLRELLGLCGDPETAHRPLLTDADVIHLAHREGLRPEAYESETLRGQPRQVLVDEIGRWQADLLVVGAHQHGLKGVRLGSVTEHLVRESTCPVLVVNGRRPLPPRRILFPVDLSDFSRHSLACGFNFLDQIARPEDDEPSRAALLAVPAELEAGEGALETWLEAAGLESQLTAEVVAGRPAETIVDRARQEEVDLVVMGTHGYGSHAFPRRGIGSVTGEVLDRATCHLLIVPPKTELGAELAEAVTSQTEPGFTSRRSP